ncbi:MAG: NAD(P)/FAD-dependent oxidoreductase, partial [Acidobacteria bacterium]|nr:NAD(P)/FAD-dependent oxidoreductase [Acidobacteriota bacterium]
MHDVIIIGAGPAGLSAALWCDELGLDTLVLEQAEEVGGQLLHVYNPVANYLGVLAKDGPELLARFASQTDEAEFDLWTQVEVERVDLRAHRLHLRSGEDLRAVTLIIATGVRRRRLNVEGEEELRGRGVVESGVLYRE